MKRIALVLVIIPLLLLAASMAFAEELKVVVEAEKYLKEENGALKKIDGRVESSGNSCISTWNDKGHVIEWEVNIPATAEYKVVLRFANGRDWETYRDLKIDGAYPSDAFKKIGIPATGGFSKDSNNWVNITVVDAQKAVALIKLTQGKHLIRMTNLGGADGNDGASNLDSLGFLGKDVNPNVLGKASF